MIDYEKLKKAHDIMLKHNKYFCTFEFGWNDKVKFCMFDDESENQIYHCYSIDDLISKLTELTKPQPKYKLGWFVNNNFEPESIECYAESEGYSLAGNPKAEAWGKTLYPNKESLIEAQIESLEAQIEYWVSQLEIKKVDVDRCQHESDGQAYAHASGYLHRKCIKCGEYYR